MPRDNRYMYMAHVCFDTCCSDYVNVCGNVSRVADIVEDYFYAARTIFTNVILHADKHNIPKRKIPPTSKLLPEYIRYKIEHRNNIRAQYASDLRIPRVTLGNHLTHTNTQF